MTGIDARATRDDPELRPANADTESVVGRAVTAARIDYVTGVPDSGIAGVIDRITSGRPGVTAPREDVAVALAVGAYLAGRRPLVFMKNAGLGLCIDALLSLTRAGGIPMPLLVGWAGTGSDMVGHHTAVGTRTGGLLAALDVPVFEIWPEVAVDEDALVAFIDRAFHERDIRAVVIGRA